MTEQELRKKVVDTAEDWLGANEGGSKHKQIIDTYNAQKPLPVGWKLSYADDWCAAFVSFVGIKTGLSDIILPECSCGRMIDLYKAKGRWKEADNYKPSIGDILMFDWQDTTGSSGDNTGWPDHVGIVASVSGNTMKIIEGNNGNTVAYRTMTVNQKNIRGYCLPNYASKASKTSSTSSSAAKPATGNSNTAGKKSTAELVTEVLAGKWGSGATRMMRLEAAGYDYETVQAAVNAKLSGKKSVEEIAKEVIQGKWGSGATRKSKLQAAGYDYNAVQKAVNKML